jgi:UDP-2,3-diacylglucosamine pyrophosphatase LpxH
MCVTHGHPLCRQNVHYKRLKKNSEKIFGIVRVVTSRRLQSLVHVTIIARIRNFEVEACWKTPTWKPEKEMGE